jgi:hypothetical protein
MFPAALAAKGVAEARARAFGNKRFELPPDAVFVPNLLTETTYGEQSLQHSDLALLLEQMLDKHREADENRDIHSRVYAFEKPGRRQRPVKEERQPNERQDCSDDETTDPPVRCRRKCDRYDKQDRELYEWSSNEVHQQDRDRRCDPVHGLDSTEKL